MSNIKISDCLLLLLHITNGIESYKINYYYKELINLGYVEINDNLEYVLTNKGKRQINKVIN